MNSLGGGQPSMENSILFFYFFFLKPSLDKYISNFVKLRSRSSPGPFQVHSRSILIHSNLFQLKIRWSGPGADVIVKLRSRSSPGPVQVHSRSILIHFNLFQFKIRWSGPGADVIFTVPPTHHHPLNFSGAGKDPKPIKTSSCHDILIVLWR